MATERLEHEGVEGLRVGRFGSRINSTCIVYRLGKVVVDTGPPNTWRSVRRFLRERRVARVVVTHHHEDHSGNLAPIENELQSEIFAPADGIEPLARGFRLRPYQRIIWGRPDRVRPKPLPDAIPLDGGRVLEPLAAPGHSSDMTCFLEADRGWLFSGDLYISSRTHYLRQDESVAATMATLRSMLAIDFGTLFCAHRGPIEDGKGALGRKLAFFEELCGRIGELHDRGVPESAIAGQLLGREGFMRWMTLGHFSKRNLVHGCLEALG